MLEASEGEDELASVLLTSMFPAINDAVASVSVVTTDATAGARTYTAAEFIGGLILRDPAGAGRSDVTPTPTPTILVPTATDTPVPTVTLGITTTPEAMPSAGVGTTGP